jgi:hypothetical protein
MEHSMFAKKSSATKKEGLIQAIRLTLENFESYKDDYKVFNIVKIGRLLEGVAFYHELDQYYNCVGFEVEVESQFCNPIDGFVGELERQVGFYSLWCGKSSPHAPVTFEMGYLAIGTVYKFDNGLGDHLEVSKVIYTMEEIQAITDGLEIQYPVIVKQ